MLAIRTSTVDLLLSAAAFGDCGVQDPSLRLGSVERRPRRSGVERQTMRSIGVPQASDAPGTH